MTKWLRWIISDESQKDPLCSLTTASFRSSGGERRKAEQRRERAVAGVFGRSSRPTVPPSESHIDRTPASLLPCPKNTIFTTGGCYANTIELDHLSWSENCVEILSGVFWQWPILTSDNHSWGQQVLTAKSILDSVCLENYQHIHILSVGMVLHCEWFSLGNGCGNHKCRRDYWSADAKRLGRPWLPPCLASAKGEDWGGEE